MGEIRKIAVISANEDTVIVGGMAVAILAEYFSLAASQPCMTKDADFVRLLDLSWWRLAILPQLG